MAIIIILISILIFFMIGSYVIVDNVKNVASKVKRRYKKRTSTQSPYHTIYYLPKND